jgi:hypothetical protein
MAPEDAGRTLFGMVGLCLRDWERRIFWDIAGFGVGFCREDWGNLPIRLEISGAVRYSSPLDFRDVRSDWVSEVFLISLFLCQIQPQPKSLFAKLMHAVSAIASSAAPCEPPSSVSVRC